MKEILIKTKNLRKSYGNNKKNAVNVLENINVDIYKKDFTVIMGSSGSGKSTLLYSLSTMDKPSGGDIELLSKSIIGLSEKKVSDIRGKDISFIFQSINLIPDLTAFENIAYPAYMAMEKEEVNRAAESLLKKFKLMDQADKYPSEMSGGQQQRIAVARAVIKNPQILFADEPTGALNSSSGNEVLDMFTKLNEEGQSIVMVTHDIKACVRGNRLLYLNDGKVVLDEEIGKYKKENQKNREETVFKLLEKNNW